MDFPGRWAAEWKQTQLRKERRSHRVLRLWVSPASRKRRRGSRRSRTPPRRAHDTLQPQDESIIVGYYTSAEVHPQKLPVSQPPLWARKEFYGKRRRYPSYQRKKYETDHTQTEKRATAQRARKRIVYQSGYSPGTLLSECSLQETGRRLSGTV